MIDSALKGMTIRNDAKVSITCLERVGIRVEFVLEFLRRVDGDLGQGEDGESYQE